MSDWVVVAGILVLPAVLIVLGNIVLCFQLAMQGASHPNRWYMLFFACHEFLLPYLRESFLARLALLGAVLAWVLLAVRLLANSGPGARITCVMGIVVLLYSFLVPAWRSR